MKSTVGKPFGILLLLAIFSSAVKIYLAGLGHNFDLESWNIFAELILEGKNVYAETYRNPYGPLWSYVCAATRYAQYALFGSSSLEDFHRLLAFILSLVDVGIAFLLSRRFSLVAGALFLVNPVSALVTGFHTQFGNLAIAIALISCLALDRNRDRQATRFALAMLLLGVSLAVKHILIFLPLWFFLRPNASRRERVLALSPFFVFGASFLPFVRDERAYEGVIEHVLMYDSFHLDSFFPQLLGTAIPLQGIEILFAWVPVFSGFKFVWMAAMMLTGFAVRRRGYVEQLLVYLVAMVVFSSAMADQYLAIPLAACAVYWRHFTVWWYVMVSTLYLAASQANIGMLPFMTRYAERVGGIGLDRSHSVAALFIFLALYLFGARTRFVPRAATRDPVDELREPNREHTGRKEEPRES